MHTRWDFETVAPTSDKKKHLVTNRASSSRFVAEEMLRVEVLHAQHQTEQSGTCLRCLSKFQGSILKHFGT